LSDLTAYNDTYIFTDGVWRYAIDQLPVKNAITVNRGDTITLMAPELMPDRLLTSHAAATFLGLSYETIRKYKATGLLPEPVITINNSPMWSRPVLRRWYQQRPGQGCGERPNRTVGEYGKWKRANETK
jgi:hypothetical protein